MSGVDNLWIRSMGGVLGDRETEAKINLSSDSPPDRTSNAIWSATKFFEIAGTAPKREKKTAKQANTG